MSTKDFVYGMVLGGAVGVCAGLLIAPRSGAETRAIITDRVDEVWGQGQEFYETKLRGVGQKAAQIIPNATAKGDELREKIDMARERIAAQVAKNAEQARGYVDDNIKPFVTRVVGKAGDEAEEAVEAVEEVAAEAEEAVEDFVEGAEPEPAL